MGPLRRNPDRAARFRGTYCECMRRRARARNPGTQLPPATGTLTTNALPSSSPPPPSPSSSPPSPPSPSPSPISVVDEVEVNAITSQNAKRKRPTEQTPELPAAKYPRHQWEEEDSTPPSPPAIARPASPQPGPSTAAGLDSPDDVPINRRLLELTGFLQVMGNSENPCLRSPPSDEEVQQAAGQSNSSSPLYRLFSTTSPTMPPRVPRVRRPGGRPPRPRPVPPPRVDNVTRNLLADLARIAADPPAWIVEPARPPMRPVVLPPVPAPAAPPAAPPRRQVPPTPTVRRYPLRRRIAPQDHWRNNRPRYSWDGSLVQILIGSPEDDSSSQSILRARERYERMRRRRR